MKIAIIGSRGMHATYGGIEKVLSELCPRLVSLGHEIHVFSENSGGFPERYVNGVKIVPMPAISGKYTESLSRTVFSLGKAILSDYDVINLVAVGPGSFSFVPRLLGKPTVVSIHGLDWQRDKWPGLARTLLRSAERMIVHAADEVTVVSRQLENYFNKTYGRKVAYIPNGLRVRNDRPDRFLLSEVGVEPGEYVLFASRLVPEKGAHELIEAFSRVNTSKKLVIAGGSRYDLNYVDSLYGMAKGDRFKFVGHVTGPLLDALFSGAYLYALPSHMEGLSLSLLEALGHGKACVVSDIPENLEVVGDCAFTFPVGNIAAMSDLLQTLLDDDISVSAMSSRAGKRATGQFAWDNLALQYSEIYERLGGGVRRNAKRLSESDEVTGRALGERTVGAD
jgi:glycosyltransferase involved in cell wall biosynthesis